MTECKCEGIWPQDVRHNLTNQMQEAEIAAGKTLVTGYAIWLRLHHAPCMIADEYMGQEGGVPLPAQEPTRRAE